MDTTGTSGEARERARQAREHGAQSESHRVELARLRALGRDLGAQIEQQIHKRPYAVIGAAAGIGFVAGSLFASRIGQVLLAAGIGYVAKNVLAGEVGVEKIRERIERLAGERATGE